MAIQILKEVNRAPGYVVATSAQILAGQPVMLTDANTIKPYDGTVGAAVLGLALDTNVQFASAADIPTIKVQSGLSREMSDRPAGDFTMAGLMYDGLNRGGLISVLLDGGQVEIWNDGRGDATDGGSFTLNAPVYANASGLLTSTLTDNPQVGICTKTPAGDGILGIQVRLSGVGA
jgi:hypothetical protein